MERQARVWLSLECKVMSGEMEDGFSGSQQPSVCSRFQANAWGGYRAGACVDLAECVLHQGEVFRGEAAASTSSR